MSTTEENDTFHDSPVGGYEGGPENSKHPTNTSPSLIDLLKQDAEQVANPTDVYIPIKGWERTGLAAKYHMPDSGKDLDAIATKVGREFKKPYERNLYIGIDTMIFLCSGLYVRSEEAVSATNLDGWVELDPNLTGEPVRFNEELAKILGWDHLIRAREVVRALFGGNDLAISDHVARLNSWLIDHNTDVNAALWNLGE